jgi:hypothetical protein
VLSIRRSPSPLCIALRHRSSRNWLGVGRPTSSTVCLRADSAEARWCVSQKEGALTPKTYR